MKLIYLLYFLFLSQTAFSQGAWNIGYLPIDSVSPNNIGLEVRIDFKSKKSPRLPGNIRSILRIHDTGTLFINNVNQLFIEDWKIYPDHGGYGEQFLVSLKGVSSKVKQYVGNSIIKEITNDSVRLIIEIELRKMRKKKTLILEKRTEEIWVERNKLSGFLYRVN